MLTCALDVNVHACTCCPLFHNELIGSSHSLAKLGFNIFGFYYFTFLCIYLYKTCFLNHSLLFFYPHAWNHFSLVYHIHCLHLSICLWMYMYAIQSILCLSLALIHQSTYEYIKAISSALFFLCTCFVCVSVCICLSHLGCLVVILWTCLRHTHNDAKTCSHALRKQLSSSKA